MEQSQPQDHEPKPATCKRHARWIVPAAQCVVAGLGAGWGLALIANHFHGYGLAIALPAPPRRALSRVWPRLFWRFAWSVAHEDWEWEKLTALAVDNQGRRNQHSAPIVNHGRSN